MSEKLYPPKCAKCGHFISDKDMETGGDVKFSQYLYPKDFKWHLVQNMLSIGVYPFEWDESVIDKKTLT